MPNDLALITAPEERLAALGITLPKAPPRPIGSFCNARLHRDLVFVSGQGPVTAEGDLLRGKVGGTVSTEVAREHAELVAINILAVLRNKLGSLNKVTGVVKLLGLVNAVPEFEQHPQVIDGASELLAQVFGESGIHSRSSFGVGSLPNNITVEIEAIVSIEG